MMETFEKIHDFDLIFGEQKIHVNIIYDRNTGGFGFEEQDPSNIRGLAFYWKTLDKLSDAAHRLSIYLGKKYGLSLEQANHVYAVSVIKGNEVIELLAQLQAANSGKKENLILRDAIKFRYIKLVYSKPVPVYDREGNLIEVRTEWRIYKALKEEGQNPFFLIDRDGYVNPKKLEYSVKRVDEEELEKIMRDSKSILKDVDKNFILEPVPRLKDAIFLKQINWPKFIEDLVDYKQVGVDPDFKIVRMATLPRGVHQAVNPHAQIILPGQTGKSEWYNLVGTLEDKVSDNSLIGYADSEGPKPGSLDKTELPIAFDQVESLAKGNILRYLANIMERGDALVDQASTPFAIWSKSTLIFLANPIGEAKSQYPILLEKMTKNPTMGRRFGIILYKKDAKRISSREKDLKAELSEKIALYRAVEEYAFHDIRKIIFDEKTWKWLNERNEEWVNQALGLLEGLSKENEELALFFKEFILNGWTHIRGAALNCAIVKNMDKIALKEYEIEDILRDAEEFLTEILRINFNSIQQITATYKQGKEEAAKRTFDILPIYIKEIVSAVELWRRNLKEDEKSKINLPYRLSLEEIPYIPQNRQYFSSIVLEARKGNPGKHNPELKNYFGFEIEKGEKDNTKIYVIVFDLAQNQYIKPLGILGNLGNLGNFSGEGGQEPPQNLSKLPKMPKIPKTDEQSAAGAVSSTGQYNISSSVDSIHIQIEDSKNEIQKLFRCKTCGAGPWKDPRTAKGHRDLCKDHEVIEVDVREAFE
ncbi:MAG: hypothetical protein QXE05_10505 [Nitrososphaeria archaeon]